MANLIDVVRDEMNADQLEEKIKCIRKQLLATPSDSLLERVENLEQVKDNFFNGRLSSEDMQILADEDFSSI